MAKICKDIIFENKKLSDIKVGSKPKYIFVNFDDDSESTLSLERDMEKGEINRYRIEPNYTYDIWTNTIPIEFNIVKNPDIYSSQEDAEITKEEIREITRWLTSSHLPKWLEVEPDETQEIENDAVLYKGWFDNIEKWYAFGTVFGLRLHFKCTSPFAYTKDIINKTTVSSYKNMLITNNSDELSSYCYPTIEITPKSNGEIYMCNLSDCETLKNGILSGSTGNTFEELCNASEQFAREHGYTLKYSSVPGQVFNTVPICGDTAVQFYLTDIYGNSKKCTAFFLQDTKEYRIINGGFMYMKVYRDNKVYMDCQKLFITDDTGRMVTYDKLGIHDVDIMYWFRLINGNNTLLLYGNADFKFTHKESRKVGE